MGNKKLSKGRVVDRICSMLHLDDYTRLEDIVQQMLTINQLPVYGVMVVWKPLLAGSLNFSLIGMSVDDPIILQDAARALNIVSTDLTKRALRLALQQDPQAAASEEGDDEPDG